MSGLQRLVGTYLIGFEPMLVSVVDDEVLIRLEGVPEELAAGLVGSDNSYVVVRSQLGGATVEFDEGDPAPGDDGIIDLVRADDTTMSTSVRGLRLEGLEWEAGDEDLNRELADRTAARSVPGAVLVSLTRDDEATGNRDEYLAKCLRFHPDVERTLTIESASEATMEVRGPEGFLQAYGAALLDSGIQVES